MSVRDNIEAEVARLTSERAYRGPEWGFGYWFIERVEDYSEEAAHDIVVDGPFDGGRDAVDFDEETATLTIWQFKWSNHNAYVANALTDIQRALPLEHDHLDQAEAVKLKVVSKFRADEDFLAQVKRVRTWIRKSIRRNYPHILKENIDVELYDILFFTQLYEELFGVEADLTFRAPPLIAADSLLGLVDLHGFTEHIDDEALFAFNIRKFLGLKKGSVNSKIKDTLNDDDKRERFWELNNGIVCLCTDVVIDNCSGKFENFTIVNGAQTVSTTASFLTDNPRVEDPVWCVAKVIKVESTDLARARLLTTTSNQQTAVSSGDLRSVDIVHPRLQTWLKTYLDRDYVYRRGLGSPRGATVISMKEMAQAYIAFWTDEPNIPFSRAGQLFSKDSYYAEVFPIDEVDRLNETDEEGILPFLLARVMPWQILQLVRAHIRSRIASGDVDKKWASSAYHMVWLYRLLFEELGLEDPVELVDLIDEVVEASATDLFDALTDFERDHDIPRDLKSDKVVRAVERTDIFARGGGRRALQKVRAIIEG